MVVDADSAQDVIVLAEQKMNDQTRSPSAAVGERRDVQDPTGRVRRCDDRAMPNRTQCRHCRFNVSMHIDL